MDALLYVLKVFLMLKDCEVLLGNTFCLLFPKCLRGEWRWLEQTQIQQIYKYLGRFLGMSGEEGWVDLHWAEKENVNEMESEEERAAQRG